ncbi:hypothetical protein EHS25_000509 [Saitozyma podzolica]|uniref:J domain-containing protein n=1 Tax=Saitozyma podzolica TaxID=1890683 RepID=A0A427YWG7_9TREE|nr:hypothetical protein EHS25_000509 [Saitozyma podzolica]
MEVNKEEALRCLSIAQRHRSSSNLPSALKFAKKSVSLYSTPEGEALVTIIEREITVSSSTSTSTSESSSPAPTPNEEAGPSGAGSRSRATASGVEEHMTSAHARPGHAPKSGTTAAGGAGSGAGAAGSGSDKGKKREYTVKQMEVVKRVKTCQHHQYYEILAVERTCTENDVKKAYKKLALALHPDKNGAPGADEAFKMVSKAFQVLSDTNLRAAFDSNPNSDPTQRGGGVPSRGGGGMHPGFGNGGMYTEVNPEDLFNAFFGGGMGGGSPFGGQFGNANVFTFGGPGGFQAQFGGPRRRAAAAGGGENASPIVALLPIILLFAFALLSVIPSLFTTPPPPDPSYSWDSSSRFDLARNTWHRGVPYHVNKAEWEGSHLWESVPEARRGQKDAAMYSNKVRSFERGVETNYIQKLRNECEYFNSRKQQQISQEAGFFGIGANYDKIRELRAQKSPSCEQLRSWGLMQAQGATF